MTLTSFLNQQYLDKFMPSVTGVTYRVYQPYYVEQYKGLDNYGFPHMSTQDRKNHINHQSECGPSVAVFVESDLVAIFGMVLVWKGVGEAWSTFDEKARRYPIAMTKSAFTFFDICEILFNLHRVQITVDSNDSRAMRWAKCLKFESEGLMKEYSSDKKDYHIMRRK
ncbi:putative acetyltransferase [Methylophilales phage MEP301]|nr:putative acetyltransferase [Methylophilales phage MEP301]